MIYSQIKNLIIQAADPHVVELFDRAIALFDKFEIDEYLDTLESSIGENISGSEQQVIDSLTLCITDMVEQLLEMHGVVLNDNAVLSDKITIADGLFSLTTYQDKETIRLALNTPHTKEECLAELLAMTTSMHADNILALLDSVDVSFIDNYKELMNLNDTLTMVSIETTEKAQACYKQFKAAFGDRSVFADRYTATPETLGLPFQTYFKLYMLDHHELFDPEVAHTEEDVKSIALNLLSLAVISNETVYKARDLLAQSADEIYSELSQFTKLNLTFNNLLLEYDRA